MKATPEFILASQSPRRRQLLQAAGYAFRIIMPDVEEIPRADESPARFARRAACDKARAVAATLPPSPRPRVVVACDTIVALGPRIFGKPKSPAGAIRMLKALSGRTHEVISGLALLRIPPAGHPHLAIHSRSRTVRTHVKFRRLTREEIQRYVASGEPMDKAGAYAIQEGAAGMVVSIRGSYTNVVGLPLAELIAWLAAAGIPVTDPAARP